MDEKIYEIGVAQFNPYVRYVNRLEGAVHENHIVPWRILYDFEIIFVTKGSLQVLKEDSDERRLGIYDRGRLPAHNAAFCKAYARSSRACGNDGWIR